MGEAGGVRPDQVTGNTVLGLNFCVLSESGPLFISGTGGQIVYTARRRDSNTFQHPRPDRTGMPVYLAGPAVSLMPPTPIEVPPACLLTILGVALRSIVVDWKTIPRTR